MDITQTNPLRNEFLLDPTVIYFNHGSYGATPRPVFESYQRWQRELENQPCIYFRHLGEHLEQSRSVLAEYIGTSSKNLAYITNATTGVNVVAHSLQLQPGDEILTSNHEYGAVNRTWEFYAQKQGYKYINQPIPVPVKSAGEFVEQLWQGVTSHTKVISLSHITSPTALIFPIAEVCKRAREQGIITVIDGAHAPGQITLNLDELGADFYTGNLHKWLCAPKGAAFLYARPELHHLIDPLVVSWGWIPPSDIDARTKANPLIDFVERQGTTDSASFLAVPDAIQFYKDHDWDTTVRSTCQNLLQEAIRELSTYFSLPTFSDLTTDWISQMGCGPIPASVDCPEIHNRLYDEYHIEIPVGEWRGNKMVRISVQGYNSAAEVETLVNALKTLTNHGRK